MRAKHGDREGRLLSAMNGKAVIAFDDERLEAFNYNEVAVIKDSEPEEPTDPYLELLVPLLERVVSAQERVAAMHAPGGTQAYVVVINGRAMRSIDGVSPLLWRNRVAANVAGVEQDGVVMSADEYMNMVRKRRDDVDAPPKKMSSLAELAAKVVE